jgi:hypothetical protein
VFGDEHRPHTDHAADQDADLRWLWRMPRRRLDAECVHDALWSAAGRLNLRMGGPSDRQFDMRPGRHVTPLVDYGLFPVADQPTQRRSVYRFLFRTLPDPFMEALDCPAGDQIVAARGNGITVQQALALWNNAQSLTAAERLATRVQEETRERPTQIDRLFWLLLSRPPAADEARQFAAYTERHGLSNACRVLVNLNEFVFLD